MNYKLVLRQLEFEEEQERRYFAQKQEDAGTENANKDTNRQQVIAESEKSPSIRSKSE